MRIKAVPGASRDALGGMLGDRLKVRVSAPPEGGKANKAIAALLARELGVRPTQVEIIAGHTSPEKTVRVAGCDPERVRALLGGGPG
ncbi:MAG: DUF167 domain-containing protein [Planctomycetota bacterium]|nr:MAG: DUF167 domain-containing protein [Planctomycetota bacterium]